MNKESAEKGEEKDDRQVYDRYRSKYSLPEFDTVQKFLELSDIEDDGLLLVSMKKKIVDKLKNYLDILEPIIHPDTSTISMYESRLFNDDEKNMVFQLFKQLMVLFRGANLTDLDENDEANAAFINSFFELFPKIKPDLEKMIRQQKESWEKEDTSKSDVGYLG